MSRGIILYGPPAAGKDTIADLLAQQEGYEKFKLLRTGSADHEGYRYISPEALEKRTDILWRNDKYNATYAVDEAGLRETMSGAAPIVQLGEVVAVETVTAVGSGWVVVSLWCSREEAKRRLDLRGNVNIAERLKAWDETKRIRADIYFRTDRYAPAILVRSLLNWVQDLDSEP